MHILIVFSNIENSLAFYWMAEGFAKQKHRFTYVFMHPHKPALATKIEALGNDVIHINYNGKKDVPKVTWQLYGLFKNLRPDVMHAHLFDASICAITAAWLARIKKRVYTRHHSDFHHISFKQAVKYDKWINGRATHIIAISESVKDILIHLEHAKPHKIHLVHHGFRLDELMAASTDSIALLNQKYNPNKKHPVIGVIARYTYWKGIQYIIPAFERLLKQYPDALLLMANATGSYTTAIDDLLKKLPESSWRKITFEPNIAALYKLFDVFVHVPISKPVEAFGQVYIEALAAGIPSVFTNSGIAPEFIKHGKHAFVVDFCNSHNILEGMLYLLKNNSNQTMIEDGKQAVGAMFHIDTMIKKLIQVYEQ
jgi:glycosyltransferase involved in cell wall biosynthesis